MWGFASFVALGLGACSNDAIDEPEQTLTPERSIFIPVSVNSFGNGLTRGGTLGSASDTYDPTDDPFYAEGTKDENEVKSVYLVFYDSNRERVAYTQSLLSNNNSTLTPGDANTDPNVNKLYTGIVQVDLTEGRSTPTYVLAFINPESTSDFSGPDFKTLGDVEQLQRTSLISGNNFPMSNSVYYGPHIVTGNQNARIMATPIPNDKIFPSKTAAENAISQGGDGDETAYIDIYVERYAAKVNFSIDPEAIENIPMTDLDGNEVVLKFVPEAWAVNAVEKKTFVTKNFFGDKGGGEFDFSQPATFESLDQMFGGDGTTSYKAWKWNSAENHRSYWGQSPGYYEAKYPRVADDIMDAEGWRPGQHDGYAGSFPLNYYSYKEILDGANASKLDALSRPFSGNATTAIYAREGTVSGQSLHNAFDDPTASPMSAIASVVLVGSYQVDNGNTGKFKPFEGTFYVTGNATNGYKFYDKDQILNYFINTTLKLAKNENGDPFFNYQMAGDEGEAEFLEEDYKKYFSVQHPSAVVRGNLVMDSRYVTVQLNEAAKGNIYAKVGDVYMPVNDENINTINQSIMSGAGTAYGFEGGKAYFSVPIQHLGFYSSKNENKGKNPLTSDFNWDKTKSGEFGLVRNHVYTIQATKISGLGNGIPDVTIPIVPPTEPEYYIGARINILNWAIVPTQTVEW